MFRKISLCLMFLLMSSVSVLAAPLNDYSLGKTAIDVTFRPNLDMDLSNTVPSSWNMEGERSNFEYGLTIGLGNKFAFQYRNFSPDTKALGANYRPMDSDEINLLYQVEKGLSVFAGSQRTKYTQIHTDGSIGSETEYSRSMQYGLVGSIDLGNKFAAFGLAGFGSHVTNYEIGLAYAIDKNLDFNVSYRNFKGKEMQYVGSNTKADYDVTGIGYGVTFKF